MRNNRIELTLDQTDLLETIFTPALFPEGEAELDLYTNYGVKIGTFEYTEEDGKGFFTGEKVMTPKFTFAQYYKGLIRKGDV